MDEKYDEAPPAKRRRLNSMFSEVGQSQLNLEDMENVIFVVGNNESDIERIGGNRTIFSIQSSIFKAQLFGKMAESKSDEIVIEDVTPDAFNFIKNMFYCKDVELNLDIVLDVLYASKKYLLVDLECECYKYIEKIDKLENWWKIMKKQKVEDQNMKFALFYKSEVMIINSNKILSSQSDINQLDPKWLSLLVESSSFTIGEEHKIWEMCLNYSKSHANNEQEATSQMMNKFFVPYIRFPLMNRDYVFENIICGPDAYILNSARKIDVIKSFVESPRLYRYDSEFDWRPRVPLSFFDLAEYDIKRLTSGDNILVLGSKGCARRACVDKIEWQSVETKNEIKRLTFTKSNRLIENKLVASLNGGMFDAASLDSDIDELEQRLCGSSLANLKQRYNIVFATGDQVEYRCWNDDDKKYEWKRSKVERIYQEKGSFWKYVACQYKKEQRVHHELNHCWWFGNIRKIAN